ILCVTAFSCRMTTSGGGRSSARVRKTPARVRAGGQACNLVGDLTFPQRFVHSAPECPVSCKPTICLAGETRQCYLNARTSRAVEVRAREGAGSMQFVPIQPPKRWSAWIGFLVLIASGAVAAGSARPFAGSWNDGSRLAAVESLVDAHTFAIDDSIF